MPQQLTLGEYIRRRRKELKLSLGDLARKVEVSYTYMSKLENDRQLPSEITLFRLSRTLEVPFAEFLKLSDRLPSDIIQNLLEEQANPSVTARRGSGVLASDKEAAQALVDNVPKELISALADFFGLDPSAPDALELVRFLQVLARMDRDTRSSLVDFIAKLTKEKPLPQAGSLSSEAGTE